MTSTLSPTNSAAKLRRLPGLTCGFTVLDDEVLSLDATKIAQALAKRHLFASSGGLGLRGKNADPFGLLPVHQQNDRF